MDAASLRDGRSLWARCGRLDDTVPSAEPRAERGSLKVPIKA